MKNNTWSRLYKMLKPEKRSIVIISFIAILINIGEVIKPYLIQIVIDDYLSMGIWEKGAITIGMIGATYIGIVIFRKSTRLCDKNNYNNGW